MYAQLFASLFKIQIEPPHFEYSNESEKYFECIQHRHKAANNKLVCSAFPSANIGLFRLQNV